MPRPCGTSIPQIPRCPVAVMAHTTLPPADTDAVCLGSGKPKDGIIIICRKGCGALAPHACWTSCLLYCLSTVVIAGGEVFDQSPMGCLASSKSLRKEGSARTLMRFAHRSSHRHRPHSRNAELQDEKPSAFAPSIFHRNGVTAI